MKTQDPTASGKEVIGIRILNRAIEAMRGIDPGNVGIRGESWIRRRKILTLPNFSSRFTFAFVE